MILPTFRMITDAAVETGCADLLPVVEQYHRDFRQTVGAPNGFTVLPRINAEGLSAVQLRQKCLAAKCDYNVLVGDNVPWIYQKSGPYGHGIENIPADGFFFGGDDLVIDSDGAVTQYSDTGLTGAHSRIYYKSQSEDAQTSAQLYRKEMQKLLDTPKYQMLYAPEVWVDDHFAFPGYEDIGNGTRAQLPANWTLRDKRGLAVSDTGASRTDGEWESLAARPVLVNVNLDGGFQPGFYNTGYSADWLRLNPGAFLEIGFGSFFNEVHNDQNLMVGCTLGDWCHTSFCNWWGQMQIGLFFAGRPIGDVLMVPGFYAAKYFTSIHGWCTHMLTDSQMALVEQAGRITTLEQNQAKMQADIVTLKAGGGSGPPPPGIVVLQAVYRPEGSQALSGLGTADAKTALQSLINAGKTIFVHPDITLAVGDPAVGTVKEFFVSWTHDGAPHTQIFRQDQQVVL